jgi:hypothetical protein
LDASFKLRLNGQELHRLMKLMRRPSARRQIA